MNERLAIVGGGAIACGLAATAAHCGTVLLLTRSEHSAKRAGATVARTLTKLGTDIDPARIQIANGDCDLAGATFIVEAIVEAYEAKEELLAKLAKLTSEDTVLATTTSSLSVERLAEASGAPHRFVGLHVFNPVPKMNLVELVLPSRASASTRSRAAALCETLGKTAVIVPDIPGFVVNRLLFPYLFSAVHLLEETGVEPRAIDECMKLGAGHPMGPLALLDLVGLDVAEAIGGEIGASLPPMLPTMIAKGALGRKAGKGFYDYEERGAQQGSGAQQASRAR